MYEVEELEQQAEALDKQIREAEPKGMKSAAVPISNHFDRAKYVKVNKNDWNKMRDVLSEQVEKLKRFVASKGLGEALAEYVRSLAPKTIRQRLKAQDQMLRVRKMNNIRARAEEIVREENIYII